MSRRKTVKLNLPYVNAKITEVFRHNIIFCEKMGREKHPTWVSDWNRKDKGGTPIPKNLPSPEEAARMCVLLQTTPEEILTEPADIELVRGLIEQEREKGAEKERPADGEAPDQDKLLEIVKDSQDMSFLLKVMDEVNKSMQKLRKV